MDSLSIKPRSDDATWMSQRQRGMVRSPFEIEMLSKQRYHQIEVIGTSSPESSSHSSSAHNPTRQSHATRRLHHSRPARSNSKRVMQRGSPRTKHVDLIPLAARPVGFCFRSSASLLRPMNKAAITVITHEQPVNVDSSKTGYRDHLSTMSRATAVLRNAAKTAAETPKPMSADHTLYHAAPTVSRPSSYQHRATEHGVVQLDILSYLVTRTAREME
jgi:hypothetical protein